MLYPAHVQAAKEILEMGPGDIYPFARLAEYMGIDVNDRAVQFERLRLIRFLRARGVNLQADGAGYRRLSEPERVRRQGRIARAKLIRTLARAAHDLRTVDARQLDAGDVLRLAEEQARIGALSIWARLRQPQRYTVAKLPSVPRIGVKSD